MNRTEAKQEAQRLTKTFGREVDYRTIDCPCDYSRFCDDCGGDGSFFEFFYTFCDHKVEEDDRDSDCYDAFCAEREKARREMEAA